LKNEWGILVEQNWSFSDGVVVPPDVMHRVVGEESVLLNLKTTVYFGADSVATRMWLTLTRSETIQAAFESLLAEYEVTPMELRHDLAEFIQQLRDHQLIEIKQSSALMEKAV
jgi:hypothetical protein